MALTVGQIIDRTRELLTVDADELPDSLLLVFLQEGFDRILERVDRWRHLEVDESFTTVANQREYTLTTVVDIRQVVNVTDVHAGALLPIPSEQGEAMYSGVHDIPSWPRFWSTWDGALELWPTPDAAYNIKVRGYRAPRDFIAEGLGALPDLPPQFHSALLWWVIACAYDQQEDPEMSTKYQQKFEEIVAVLTRSATRGHTASPFVLNGERRTIRTYEDQVRDLTWRA